MRTLLIKMDCTVCMNTFEDNIYSTYCGHLFCNQCSNEMITSSLACWTCNTPLSSNKIHKIYIPETSQKKNLNKSSEHDGVTQGEILQTMISDFDIKSTKYEKEIEEYKDLNDAFALKLATYTSLQENLLKRTEAIEGTLEKVQERLGKLQCIMDKYDLKDSIILP